MSTPSSTDPHKAAPGELDLVRTFVNTYDLETHEEEIGDPAALTAWLTERDLLHGGEPLADSDVRQAQAVREALRKLILANNGAPLDPQVVDALNTAGKSAELAVRFAADTGAAALAPVRPGFDGALGRLLAIVFRAMADGSWERLKACADHGCEWAFYDWSKNRSGTWCDMKVCGNRAKARAYRERRQRGAHTQEL